MITGEQSRAGRGALGWSAERLAREAGTCRRTVQRLENGGRLHPLFSKAIRDAMHAAGVRFIAHGVLLVPNGDAASGPASDDDRGADDGS